MRKIKQFQVVPGDLEGCSRSELWVLFEDGELWIRRDNAWKKWSPELPPPPTPVNLTGSEKQVRERLDLPDADPHFGGPRSYGTEKFTV